MKKGEQLQPLFLDGESLELVSVELDGELLPDSAYDISEVGLTLKEPKNHFTLKIVNLVNPESNKSLEGLYKSGDMFCTQCEAEGFRRITYFMDRPDVMTVYRTTLIADKDAYPVLLSNGNPVKSGNLDGNRHYAVWEDPFKKPTYLFALVAGDLGLVTGNYRTKSGKDVELRVYCDKGIEDKCDFTIQSLQQSMRWDEERWGLEYDLDIYMIVAVDSFNMGAMENKGLNIFNSKYVLATPETATDSTYASIQAIVGHEYFHNWTGNRVTCRDWFQLTLKEGLTVFRDQEFSSDLNSRPAERVNNMLGLKSSQFIEDSGPNAHSIKPKAYMDINNFYTATVYSKGSEVIRMYHTLLGEAGFRKGMDKYFELFDGQAVTTEDFLHAMSTANDNYDFTHFSKWYDQAGTPLLQISDDYSEERKEYSLKIKQINKPTAGQEEKFPLFMPFKIGLLDGEGNDIRLTSKSAMSQISDSIVHISKDEETFVFSEVNEKPVVSLNRDFSAPVNIDYAYSEDELAFLMANDSDDVARYNACQILFEKVLLDIIDSENKNFKVSEIFFKAFSAAFKDSSWDNQIKALALRIPSAGILAQRFETIDYVKIQDAIDFLADEVAKYCRPDILALYNTINLSKPYVFQEKDVGERAIANLLISYLGRLENSGEANLSENQFKTASNMTLKLGAFKSIVHNELDFSEEAIERFYEEHKAFDASLQEWMRVICSNPKEGALLRMEKFYLFPSLIKQSPTMCMLLSELFQQIIVTFTQKMAVVIAF